MNEQAAQTIMLNHRWKLTALHQVRILLLLEDWRFNIPLIESAMKSGGTEIFIWEQ